MKHPKLLKMRLRSRTGLRERAVLQHDHHVAHVAPDLPPTTLSATEGVTRGGRSVPPIHVSGDWLVWPTQVTLRSENIRTLGSGSCDDMSPSAFLPSSGSEQVRAQKLPSPNSLRIGAEEEDEKNKVCQTPLCGSGTGAAAVSSASSAPSTKSSSAARSSS